MQSPMAPGRIRSLRWALPRLLNNYRHADFNGGWPETHPVIAGLVMQFPDHCRRPRRCILGNFELSLNAERAREHGQHVVADLQFLGFGIVDGLGLEGAGGPGEAQWDDKLIFGFVAVHMKTGERGYLNRRDRGFSALDGDLFDRTDDQFILLGRR